MSVLTRRTVLRSFAAASALPVIGAPMIARAAEIELKYGNNLPLSHPLNIRAQEAAERVARETNGRVEIKTALPVKTPVLAARFDNLKDGAPALVRAPTASQNATRTKAGGAG